MTRQTEDSSERPDFKEHTMRNKIIAGLVVLGTAATAAGIALANAAAHVAAMVPLGWYHG